MVTCAAYGCNNRSGRDKVSFHRFPDDPKLRELWIKAVNRKNWAPTTFSRLCSAHFKPSDLNNTYYSQNVYLRPGVVPCVFSPALQKHLRKSRRKRLLNEKSASTKPSDAPELHPTSANRGSTSTSPLRVPSTSAEDKTQRKEKIRMESHGPSSKNTIINKKLSDIEIERRVSHFFATKVQILVAELI